MLFFLYIFRIYSLKIFACGGLGQLGGATAHSIAICIYAPGETRLSLKLLCCQWWWMLDVLSSDDMLIVIPTTLTIDGMFEDICYIIHAILCNDMTEVRWDIWLSLYCKFHGECNVEIILKIVQLIGRVVCGVLGGCFFGQPCGYMNTQDTGQKGGTYINQH